MPTHLFLMSILKKLLSIRFVFTLYLMINGILIHAQAQLADFYQLSKNTFINKYEVTNQSYNYFLEDYSGEISVEILSINNHLWTNSKSDIPLGSMYKDLYHSTKKWEQHPVVNINQEAAKTYCKWLTEVYNSKSDRAYQKVVFRLPNEKEWLKAYKKVKNQIDIQSEKLQYSEKFPCKEKKLNEEEKKLHAIVDGNRNPSPQQFLKMTEVDQDKITDDMHARPVNFFRDKYEAPIYNLVGNVSEWLSEENIAIASNWNVKNDKSMKELIAPFEATSPSPVIGFRIVMEVIEE